MRQKAKLGGLTMKCQQCSQEIPQDSKFCPYCGSKPTETSKNNFYAKTIAIVGAIAAIMFLISGFVSLDHISSCMEVNKYNAADLTLVHLTWLSFGLSFLCVMITVYLIFKIYNSNK